MSALSAAIDSLCRDGFPPMDAWIWQADNVAATVRLGQALGDALVPGTVVALDGPLGAGKTLLVQATVAALGVRDQEVASPSFVLVRQYSGRYPIQHLDLYRIRDRDELWELGIEELFQAPAIALVEWAGKFPEDLPTARLDVLIEVLGPHQRQFHLTARGDAAAHVLTRVAAALTRSG